MFSPRSLVLRIYKFTVWIWQRYRWWRTEWFAIRWLFVCFCSIAYLHPFVGQVPVSRHRDTFCLYRFVYPYLLLFPCITSTGFITMMKPFYSGPQKAGFMVEWWYQNRSRHLQFSSNAHRVPNLFTDIKKVSLITNIDVSNIWNIFNLLI